jgi:hypothetical protein
MKIFTSIFSFLLLLSSVWAQNALFIPFGQTMPQVQEFVATRDYIHVSEARDSLKDRLLVNQVSARQKLTYVFQDEMLYAVEDFRTYDNKKQADAIIEACVDYMGLEERRVRTVSSSGGTTHYAALAEDRIIEFFVTKDRKADRYELRLKVTSRLYGPRMETETFAMELAGKGM